LLAGRRALLHHTDTLCRVWADGTLEDVITELPGRGDHQANYPVVGPDGKIYFGVGSATNAGVVSADNFAYEWLPRFPEFHDVPAQDVTLVGRNYEFRNVLGNLAENVRSGAYVPFGTETTPAQVISGNVKCTGSILRCNPDGSNLEVVAWGLRNPYGIAFHPDGRLFATEHDMDERGARYIVGDNEDFYEIQHGAWYGWPDFASGIRLDDPAWGEGGQGREPVLAVHPDPNPPKPFLTFAPHGGANGVDFSRDPAFGFVGDAFVALFGNLAPVTTPRLAGPVGFKVVRVDMARRQVVDFAVSKVASKLPHDGFERPSHCAFGPDGALYVVDWGQIQIAPERGGLRMPLGTGALWRIRRTAGPAGERPPKPLPMPLYLLQYLAAPIGVAGLTLGAAWLLRRWHRRRK
jgi:glucose/arabinose dehydrogenase